MQCPKCKCEINNGARYCGCGWKKRADTSEQYHADSHVECSDSGCKTSALYKILKTTGWSKLCEYHYNTHFADQARSNLIKWGMARSHGETSEQHIKRMRHFVKTAFKGFAGKTMEAK